MDFKKSIPILDWLPKYQKSFLKNDLLGGLTIGIVLIPQGIAYALIAGLPPTYGLYSALIPQIIYAIFGTSKQVSVGPVAMDSLIVAAGVSTLAIAGTENYIAITILLAFLVGAIQFIMGLFNLGFIVNFLSRPVITGFTSAVAIIIGVNQFRNLLGVNFIQSDQIQYVLDDIFFKITEADFFTTIFGFISIAIIVILKKVNRKIPNAVIVVIIGIIAIKYFGQQLSSIAIVKEIPSGLPSFSIPELEIDLIKKLLPIALTLAMVGYLETISIGKSLEATQDEYRIKPNQELIALGLANIFGSFFKAFPTTSSFSRSAINLETGSRTQLSGLISVLILVGTLFFLTPLFYHLPKTILAAIIIVAIVNLIKISEAVFLWKTNKFDFWLMSATFLATLFLGIEYGIIVGVSLSLIVLIYRTSRPYVVELGKVPNSNFYRNKNRFEEVLLDDEILVFRFDAQLFYANSSYFRDKLDEMTLQKKHLKLIVLDAESINRVDSTGIEMLKDRIRFYKKKEIQFYLAGVKGPVRDDLFRSKILEVIDIKHFFMRINDAVLFYATGCSEHQEKFGKYIHQSYD